MAAEKYRKFFPYYEYKFLDAVNYAVTASYLNLILRKEQLQALYEYTRGRAHSKLENHLLVWCSKA